MPRKPTRPPRAPRARRNYVRGRGFYQGVGGDLGAALGGVAGSRLGSSVMGATLGRQTGSAVERYVRANPFARRLGIAPTTVSGRGAYKVTRNSLLYPDPPEVRNAGREGMVQIRHREYIGDVRSGSVLSSGSTTFDVAYALPLNPALPESFPWLAAIANQFTQWQPNGILVEFVSTSGNAVSSTNAALGEVMIATQYDAIVPQFTTKQQMLNQEFSCSGVPAVNHIQPVECASRLSGQTNFYTRSADAPVGTDQRLYDLGVVYVATQGQQAAGVTLGELYITYDILLMKPQLPDQNLPADTSAQVAYLRGSSGIIMTSGTNFFGSVRSVLQDTVGVQTFAENAITLAPQSDGTDLFLFHVVWRGNGNQTNNITPPVPFTLVNCTIYDQLTAPATFPLQAAPAALITGDRYDQMFGVRITDPSLPSTITWARAGTDGISPGLITADILINTWVAASNPPT